MKKRTCLKISSALLTGAVLSPIMSCKQGEKQHNWAGNLQYSTDRVHDPNTIEELLELIKNERKLKVLGTRHCFNTIADSKDNLVSLKSFDQVTIDKASNTVTVGAGVNYGQLSRYLNKNGFALHNLASLPHISVAGACATATHGSGVTNGNLATAVAALEIVTGNGDVLTLSREKNNEQFPGAVVNLGALGVVTKVTLDIQQTYNVRQDVYENLPLKQLAEHLNEILSEGYSVSLFTDWRNQNFNQVWIKRQVEEGVMLKLASKFFGAKIATKNLHPIAEISAENCTEQMGVPGPWNERLPHFKMDFTPSSGAELQSEYFVPRIHGYEALLAVDQLHERIAPHLMISEIRTIAADDLWMSPCYKQDSLAIHFTWKQDWPSVSKVLPMIEEKLSPFNVRPHWGKLFTMSPVTLRSRYEKLPDFLQLVRQFDPGGKFTNEFLDTNILGS